MSDYAEPGSGESTPFGSHMAFVAGELVPFVERNYPASPRREDRIVAGHSAGAAWAFGAAEHRPDLFGAVLAMSSRSRAAVRDAHRLRGARVYAGAGTFDDGFIAPTRDSVAAATAAGADGRFREVVGGHSRLVWEVLFTEGLAWLVPPGRQH
jgi:enterochelin esterase-like enzyme